MKTRKIGRGWVRLEIPPPPMERADGVGGIEAGNGAMLGGGQVSELEVKYLRNGTGMVRATVLESRWIVVTKDHRTARLVLDYMSRGEVQVIVGLSLHLAEITQIYVRRRAGREVAARTEERSLVVTRLGDALCQLNQMTGATEFRIERMDAEGRRVMIKSAFAKPEKRGRKKSRAEKRSLTETRLADDLIARTTSADVTEFRIH